MIALRFVIISVLAASVFAYPAPARVEYDNQVARDEPIWHYTYLPAMQRRDIEDDIRRQLFARYLDSLEFDKREPLSFPKLPSFGGPKPSSPPLPKAVVPPKPIAPHPITPPKVELPKLIAPPPKIEPPKPVTPPKVEPPKPLPPIPKANPPKPIEPPKVDAPRPLPPIPKPVEQPKIDTPRPLPTPPKPVEQPKIDTPRPLPTPPKPVEQPKVDAPKPPPPPPKPVEHPKVDVPKPPAPAPVQPQQEYRPSRGPSADALLNAATTGATIVNGWLSSTNDHNNAAEAAAQQHQYDMELLSASLSAAANTAWAVPTDAVTSSAPATAPTAA